MIGYASLHSNSDAVAETWRRVWGDG